MLAPRTLRFGRQSKPSYPGSKSRYFSSQTDCEPRRLNEPSPDAMAEFTLRLNILEASLLDALSIFQQVVCEINFAIRTVFDVIGLFDPLPSAHIPGLQF